MREKKTFVFSSCESFVHATKHNLYNQIRTTNSQQMHQHIKPNSKLALSAQLCMDAQPLHIHRICIQFIPLKIRKMWTTNSTNIFKIIRTPTHGKNIGEKERIPWSFSMMLRALCNFRYMKWKATGTQAADEKYRKTDHRWALSINYNQLFTNAPVSWEWYVKTDAQYITPSSNYSK